MEPIRITRATTLKKRPKDSDLGFGKVFTDHMFVMDFQEEKGWYDPRVEPYAPFSLDPAAAVLHYAHSYIYFVILSPVGAYYPEGMNPVKILVVDTYVRAVEGGVGAVKTAGNYAASLLAAEEAKHAGYTQVLWLDGVHRKYLDEVGTMNIMVKIGNEIITPPLTGTILPGVTRDSALTLLRAWGLKVSERQVSIDEVVEAHGRGKLEEVWGTGTAAVISPVGELAYQGKKMLINGGKIGPLTQRLYDAIVAIQYGKAPDPDGWTLTI